MLTGKPTSLIAKLVDPLYGLLAEEKFLTIASVNEWFAKEGASQYQPLPEHKLLPPCEEEPISHEEGLRRREKADAAIAAIKNAAKMRTVHFEDERAEKLAKRQEAHLRKLQQDDPAARLRALENLEAMNRREG